jgi:hypothetical protein
MTKRSDKSDFIYIAKITNYGRKRERQRATDAKSA